MDPRSSARIVLINLETPDKKSLFPFKVKCKGSGENERESRKVDSLPEPYNLDRFQEVDFFAHNPQIRFQNLKYV